MKLESQVCSLDLAKRLKELGVKQESLFYHAEELIMTEINDDTGHYETGDWMPVISAKEKETNEFRIIFSAFTVAELGEMLTGCPWLGITTYQTGSRRPTEYYFNIHFRGMDSLKEKFLRKMKKITGEADICTMFSADTEANARAKMLVYLLENKLI